MELGFEVKPASNEVKTTKNGLHPQNETVDE